MAHLFEMIHPNFFSVLASPNKKTYVDCIFIIYNAVDSIEESFQGDREYVVQRLIDYFDDKESEEFADVSEDEKASTSRQKANHVINVLKNNGWIGEEELGDYKTSINLFDYSIRIITILDDIVNARQDEYTGEIFAIYSLLNAFTKEEGIGVIEQAFQKTNEVIRKLKTLKANIYRYYFDVTKKQSKQDLQKILEKLLVEYKQNFFDSAYYNLKTKDSLPRYKRGILSGVSNIYDNVEVMDHLANLVMQTKRIDDYNVAFEYLETRLRFITDSFSALENLILDIDRKNEQYISATASKILFLTNHSDDIEGIFNRLFKLVLNDDDFEYNSIIHMAQIKNLDTYSLYNQRRVRMDSEPEELYLDDDFITDEKKREKIALMLKHNMYSKKEINKYVLEILNGSKEILASELQISSQEEYVKLILIFLYSKSIGMSYDIDLLDYEAKTNFVSFKNFTIKVKR
ncbi:Wadjet anti-phage system protein JetA family protein [Haploplasma axanthum]|nr:Wadjet anti-phage system protein JetA family protein [Haploplasma axanthum]